MQHSTAFRAPLALAALEAAATTIAAVRFAAQTSGSGGFTPFAVPEPRAGYLDFSSGEADTSSEAQTVGLRCVLAA